MHAGLGSTTGAQRLVCREKISNILAVAAHGSQVYSSAGGSWYCAELILYNMPILDSDKVVVMLAIPQLIIRHDFNMITSLLL
jgi:hypothetical protein